jgi:hypothetical protein
MTRGIAHDDDEAIGRTGPGAVVFLDTRQAATARAWRQGQCTITTYDPLHTSGWGGEVDAATVSLRGDSSRTRSDRQTWHAIQTTGFWHVTIVSDVRLASRTLPRASTYFRANTGPLQLVTLAGVTVVPKPLRN